MFFSLEKSYRPSNAKAIYTAALKWFDAKYKPKESSIQKLNVEFVCETTAASDSNVTNNDSFSENGDKDSKMRFKIELSFKVWETISPVKKDYGCKSRTYHVLKPGVWSNVIVDAVTKKRPLIPCSWSFETNKCYLSDARDMYLTIRAKCNTCGASLCGAIESEPMDNNPVYIEFEIRGLDAIRHVKAPTKNVP